MKRRLLIFQALLLMWSSSNVFQIEKRVCLKKNAKCLQQSIDLWLVMKKYHVLAFFKNFIMYLIIPLHADNNPCNHRCEWEDDIRGDCRVAEVGFAATFSYIHTIPRCAPASFLSCILYLPICSVTHHFSFYNSNFSNRIIISLTQMILWNEWVNEGTQILIPKVYFVSGLRKCKLL